MEFSWNPNTKYTEVPQLSISAHLFVMVETLSRQAECVHAKQLKFHSDTNHDFVVSVLLP